MRLQKPFGEFSSMITSDFASETRSSIHNILSPKAEWMGKYGIAWPWKGNERGCYFDSRSHHFCWNWLYDDPEDEYGQGQPRKCAANDNKALGRRSSLFNKTDMMDNCSKDCEIKWEDLMIREQVGRGQKKIMANNGNMYAKIPLASCDEVDSPMKRPRQSNKKTTTTTNGSSSDSDYVPIEESKGGSLRRVWTEKDEITLLKALKNQSNKSDMTELFNSVKTSLNAEVSKTQLSDKVRKLRNKFKKSVVVDVVHLEGHKAKVHKLCQQLWGGEDKSVAVAVARNDDDERRIELDFVVDYPRMNSRLPHLYPAANMTSEGYNTLKKLMMTHLSQKELKAMEKKWVDLYLEEIRVIGTKRMLLMEEQMSLIEKARKMDKNQINKKTN